MNGARRSHSNEDTPAGWARMQAVRSDLTELCRRLGDGTITNDDIAGVFGHLASLGIDRPTLLDTAQIPTNAGPRAAGLERILRRIPPGWGRWISHEAGWYPIVLKCDERLAAIDPEYIVYEVKEKFGTLRYDCSPSGDQPETRTWEMFDDITAAAEQTSAVTCERCGSAGELRARPYFTKTLCERCVVVST